MTKLPRGIAVDEFMGGRAMKRTWMKTIVVLAGALMVGVGAFALTADEILDRMQDESETFMGSGMVMTGHFTNDFGNDVVSEYAFRVFVGADHALIYFTEPEWWLGVILLFNEDAEGETRVWQYLPAVGQPKELDSEGMGGSFAGSSMSIGDIAQDDWRDDYTVALLREETLMIGDQERAAYVLELTAKADADVDDVRIKMWIDAEHFADLKSEYYNDLGNVSLTQQAVELTEFEGRTVVAVQQMENSEVITTSVMEYRRVEADGFPDEIFLPENIVSFRPEEWGF